MKSFKLPFIIFVVFDFFSTVNAQSSLKISRIDSPPKIDGVLSVDEWKDATKTELFYQKEPQENDKPTKKMEVFLAFDSPN